MLEAFALAAALAAPSPTPSPPATPVPDPCGSILSLVGRPTVTTAACTVRAHRILVETGWSNTITTGAGGGATTSFPQTFIHVGTWDSHLEFTVAPPSWNRTTVGGTALDGTSDANFGAKYELGYDAKAVWGVDAIVTVPSGDLGFTGGKPQYQAAFNWTYALGPVYGLAGSINESSVTAFDASNTVRAFTVFDPTLNLSAALPNTAQAFVEYAYFSHAGLGLGPKSLIDFGYIRDLTPYSQIDVEYGYSPTPILGQKQHFVGFGFSFMD